MKSSSVVRLALIGSVSVSLPALVGCGNSCSIDTKNLSPQQIQQYKREGKLDSSGRPTCTGSSRTGYTRGFGGSSRGWGSSS